MTKINVPTPSLARKTGSRGIELFPVTGLEVGLSSSGETVILTLDWLGRPGNPEIAFVLSPPAAKLLSRQLKKAVKDYLDVGSQEKE